MSTYKVIPERLAKIETLSLHQGRHQPDSTFCVMEAVAFVAGEPWSDHPACACPIITSLLIRWNDRLPNNAERDRLLKHFIPRIVGTRNPAVEMKRAIMIGDWTVRTVIPELLRLLKRNKEADELAALPEISSAAKLVEGLARALDLVRTLDLDIDRDLILSYALDIDLALNLDLDLAIVRALCRKLETSQSTLVERMIACTE